MAYLIIGKLIAQDLVDFTENKFGVQIYEYNVKKLIANNFPVEISVNVINESDEVVDSDQVFQLLHSKFGIIL